MSVRDKNLTFFFFYFLKEEKGGVAQNVITDRVFPHEKYVYVFFCKDFKLYTVVTDH